MVCHSGRVPVPAESMVVAASASERGEGGDRFCRDGLSHRGGAYSSSGRFAGRARPGMGHDSGDQQVQVPEANPAVADWPLLASRI